MPDDGCASQRHGVIFGGILGLVWRIRDRSRPPQAGYARVSGGQGLGEILDQIVRVLEPDREAQQVVGDAEFAAALRRQA